MIDKNVKILRENVTASPDVATIDQNLTVGQMYQQSTIPSLGRLIFEVLPISGPIGSLFNLRNNSLSDKIELIKNQVEVFESVPILTGLTQEVVRDLMSQYGINSYSMIGKLLRGLSNKQENEKTLEFLDIQSKVESPLTITNKKDAQMVTFEVGQHVYEIILKANLLNQKTYDAWVVLPYTFAAAYASYSYVGDINDINSGLYVSRIGGTRFFVNPDPNSTVVYIGLHDFNDPNISAGVFSPYTDDIIEATDPDTGNMTYIIYNRFAITASPLHKPGDEMLFKFNISV